MSDVLIETMRKSGRASVMECDYVGPGIGSKIGSEPGVKPGVEKLDSMEDLYRPI